MRLPFSRIPRADRLSLPRAKARFRLLRVETLERRMVLTAWQNAADPYDIDASGGLDVRDIYALDQELRANGERALPPPNGPVQFYYDVDGDEQITLGDTDRWLRFMTGTLQEPGSTLESGSESGGSMSSMSCGYSATLNPVGDVNEGESFTLFGAVTPPGSYQILGSVDWGVSPGNAGGGSIYTNPDGTFNVPHIYFDDGAAPGNGTPQDAENITLDGTIMGCPVSAATTGTVHNVSPVPQLMLFNDNSPLGGPRYKVSGTATDVGMEDYETFTINWGDGSPPTVVSDVLQNQQFTALHEYPPWELHEEPGPYIVTVSISDDDTGGAAWGPAGALMYLLDLDNDANNSGLIEPADDPLEETPPGKTFLANMDDDNDNGIPDYDDVDAVFGENDLAEFKLGFEPTIRADVSNYDNWQVTLDVVPGKGADRIWATPDKSAGTQVTLPKVWTVGTDTIPPSLYLESGPRGGEFWLELKLTPPDSPTLVVDNDPVVFFASPAIDLDTDSDNTHAIEHSPLEEQDEDDWGTVVVPGKIVLRNTDDDNGNGVPDREDGGPWYDSTNNPIIDDDLKPITLGLGRPAAEIPGYTVTLTAAGTGEIRLWHEQHRVAPVALPITWDVEDMPQQMFVEGIEYGQPTLKVQLKNPAGAVVSEDVVKFTVLTVDAMGHRPFTAPFVLVPVPEAKEDSQGVGIRRNGVENNNLNLIQVVLDVGAFPPPPWIGLEISRDSPDINVWQESDRTGGVLTPTSGDTANALGLTDNTVFVEWFSTTDWTSTFEFSVWDSLHNNKAYWDTLVFRPFNTIVIVLGGEGDIPADPPAAGSGMFDFAIEEYRESGLDVHMYNEDDVDTSGYGAVYNELIVAIQERQVRQVAIMGHSHGGGSTYSLAWLLDQNRSGNVGDITNFFTIPFTGYVDAIEEIGIPPTGSERRRPPLSELHFGQYQRNDFPNGAPSGGDPDLNQSEYGVLHKTIDDHPVIQDLLRSHLRDNVSP